jgi:hypothetical protein
MEVVYMVTAFWAGMAIGGTAAFWGVVWLLSQQEPTTSDSADEFVREHQRRVRRRA